ncbi:nucleoside-diphosphate kinase [Nocardiopsis aegyptia]|uniref:Nucleoside diphosphate kinase n=1 Tax=Nocardiopsis aegyptia TaxID=220378 RepID=A0A7Z0EPD3_9ACTN|nr:nucleoside-diphosphate kinase [Nocardiopsis aegyptia]NYJ35789.1 nucleoside diphosphate kinase [Nocardiopsis aegyptia]
MTLTDERTGACPEELLEDSYLARLGDGETVWASVRGHLSEAQAMRLKDCVFIMLKPDAIESGRHEAVLAGMKAAGWQLLHAHTVLSFGPRHFEDLYKYNLTVRNEHNMMGVWWLNGRLYAMGPGVALMFRIPPTADRTAHQRVKDLKGVSDPFAGSPGELRWEARGSNTALNLLHAADDPISTAREFLIFGTPEQLRRALLRADAIASGDPGAGPSAEAELREQLFLTQPGRRSLDLASVMIRMKSRIRAGEPSADLWRETERTYAMYREIADQETSIVHRWSRFCALNAEERRVLDRLRREEVSPLMRRLAAPEDYDFELSVEVRAECARRGVTLDAWETLALDTGLYYHQERS